MAAKQITDDDFENGILRDGRAVSFGMLMKDSLTPVQRAILETQQGSQRGGCNGYAFADAAQSKAALQDAYDKYDAEAANAWRTPAVAPQQSKATVTRHSLDDREAAYAEVELRDQNAWRT